LIIKNTLFVAENEILIRLFLGKMFTKFWH